MDVGLIMGVRNHPDRPYPLEDVYEDYIQDCVHAEQLGFDTVWIGEHHFSRDQWTPSVFPLLAAIARETERVRLGPAVLLLPFHNPLRVAEDAAVVDIVSRGRLNLGVGVGSVAEEFETFGVDFKTRFSRSLEAIEVVERCFAEEGPFSHKGRYYEFPNVVFTTKPVQKPVPIWWAGILPKSVAAAARRGYHLVSWSPMYDDELVKAGRNPEGYGHGASPQVVCVAETRDEAWDMCQDGVHWMAQFYLERTSGPKIGWSASGPLEPWPAPEELRHVEGLGIYSPFDPVYVGTPADVLEGLRRFIGRGRVTHLALQFRHPGMTTEHVRKSMDLFAREVLPHLR